MRRQHDPGFDEHRRRPLARLGLGHAVILGGAPNNEAPMSLEGAT
jgi:hypothetical protein